MPIFGHMSLQLEPCRHGIHRLLVEPGHKACTLHVRYAVCVALCCRLAVIYVKCSVDSIIIIIIIMLPIKP
jgi:hypothetical protein